MQYYEVLWEPVISAGKNKLISNHDQVKEPLGLTA